MTTASARTTTAGWPVALGQLVVVEVAAMAALAAWSSGILARTLTCAVLVCVSCLALTRIRGRWLFRWPLVLLRFRLRRRGAERRGRLEPGLPGGSGAERFDEVEIHEFVDRAGTRFGLVHSGDTWTAVLALEPPESWSVATPSDLSLTLAAVARSVSGRDVELASVRLLVRTSVAPSPFVDPRAPLALSYREVAHDQPVTQRLAWLMLTLDPSLCSGAVAARGDGTIGAHRATASVAARCVQALAPSVHARVLGPDQLGGAFAAAAGDWADASTERWANLSSGQAVHEGYRIQFGSSTEPSDLLTDLAGVACLGTTLCLSVSRRAGNREGSRAVLRTVSLPQDAEEVASAVQALGRRHRARVRAMNGEHAIAFQETSALGSGWLSGPWRHRLVVDGTSSLEQTRLLSAAVRLGGGGLVLGRDDEGTAVSWQFANERPSAVSAALDLGVALIVCYRALAAGARLHIVSDRADRWSALHRLAVDDPETVVISTNDDLVRDVAARSTRPRLVVVDQTSLRNPPRIAPRPWQCVVTLLPDLSLGWLPSTRSAGVVLTQRLSAAEAVSAGPFLAIASEQYEQLPRLSDEQMAVVERGRLTVVNLDITDAESQLLVAATSAVVA
jgi:type VII secretion protein EccE